MRKKLLYLAIYFRVQLLFKRVKHVLPLRLEH